MVMASELVEPKAEEIVANACDTLLAEFVTKAEPHIRKAVDQIYAGLLYSVQDYLRDNANWNLAQQLESAKRTFRENYELRDNAKLAAARIEALEAEVARLSKPEWFYNADDGEYTYGDISDTVDDMGHEGVMRVAGARECWKKWVAIKCVALDPDGDVDEVVAEAFDNEADALKCWPESFEAARRAASALEGK